MTVSSTTRKAGPFTGDGVVDTFPFAFKVFTDADVLVVSADASGLESTLVIDADYTVVLNPEQDVSPGGDVVLVAPLADGYSLVVTSSVDETQLTEIHSLGAFSPRIINQALDKMVILTQQVSEKVERCIKTPITSTVLPDDLVAVCVLSAETATAAAAATAADRIQTGLDVIAADASESSAADSAATATTQADNAALSASESAASAAAASLSADAALLSAGSIYATTAAGIAATSSGQYFYVVSSATADALDLYQNSAGTAVLKKTIPSSEVVSKPLWVGRKNAYPDPFFRRASLTTKLQLGRNRWWSNSNVGNVFGSWSIVANATFDGQALRRTADSGTTPLNGPLVYLDEIGAVTGDTITLYALIVGNGAVANMPGRFDSGADGVYVGGQINPVNSVGGSTITTSATPQWLRITTTVPATATRFVFYPYTSTAAKTFDLIAMWGWRGAATAGPAWPQFMDDEAVNLRCDSLALNDRSAAVDSVLTTVTDVTSASESIALDVTGAAITSSWGTPFSGWGERYTPAGVTFNALRVPFIGRKTSTLVDANKWRTINVVVRTGANSHQTGATVVAIGSALVNPESDELTDVTVLLRHPTTGALISLSDADFSGSEYFIGVYARNSSGAVADMSDHRATQANSAGQSYYLTTNNPLTSTWVAYTANARVGCQHLLLTTPVDGVAYIPTPYFLAQIPTPAPELPVPTLALPPKYYLLAGREVSMYFDNLLPDAAADYEWDIDGLSLGQHQNERWTTNPSGAQSATTVTVSAIRRVDAVTVASGTTSVVGVAASANSGATKKCLFIGDSLTQADVMTQTLLDIAGTDVMGVTMLGTRGSGSNKHEGRGGWTISDYATAGRTFYSFTVSGVTVSPQINSTEYSNNSSTFRVQEVSLSGGSGTLICERVSGSNAPSASGTLTKTTGTGDATIAFSASSTVSGNPFWISGALNFPQYLTNNSLAVPDWVFIMLGTNDVFSYTGDSAAASAADGAFSTLDTLITSIKAAGAGVKVALIPPPCPSRDQDAFGASYGAEQTRWRFKRNIIKWCGRLYVKYTGQEASRIYICPATLNLDTTNNMQRSASAAANSRTAVTSERQNNGVHPASSGYQQIGDAVWAFLKNQ